MDILEAIFNAIKIDAGTVAFVFAVTYGVKKYTDKRQINNDWLLLVPLILGGALGFAVYFAEATSPELAASLWWQHVLKAFKLSLAYAGIPVLIWQAKKLWQKYFPGIDETT